MTYGSLIDTESQKIKKKECALHYRGGAVFFYEVFWFMPVSRWSVDGHIR